MATIYRITQIFLLLGLALILSPEARADYQAVKHYRIVYGAYTTPVPDIDYTKVCQDFVTWYDAYLTTQTVTYISSVESGCTYKRSAVTYNEIATINPMKDCSDGLGFRGWDTNPGGSGGKCLGDPPPEPEECQDGRILDSGLYAGPGPAIACISSCRALRVSDGAPELQCSFGSQAGTCQYVYPAHFVDIGESCSPSNEPDPAPPSPPDCPQCDCIESGGAWGTVNGAPSCVPQGTPGSSPVTKPSRPPEVTTTTPAPTPENPNPEPVTEVTPAPVITVTPPPPGAPAGTEPTVTETTTDENGNTITTEKGKKGFCEENPAATICRDDDKSVWAGGCGSFHCEGDAVQCAISRKIHQDRCDDLAAIAQYGAAVENGGDLLGGVQQQDVQDFLNRTGPNHQTINLEGALTETGHYAFAAQCFDDLQVSAGIFNFTVPFSQLCGVFLAIGYALLAGSYLFAIRIVGII